jgi:hypothetical protein
MIRAARDAVNTLLGLLLWVPAFAVKVVLVAIGLPYVWVALTLELPLWIWGGPPPAPWWLDSAWEWYAIRNPVQGLKFDAPWSVREFGTTGAEPLEVKPLQAIGKSWGWRVALCGPLSHVRLMVLRSEGYCEFAIGWQPGPAGVDIDAQARCTTGKD